MSNLHRIPLIAGNWKMNLTLDQVQPFLKSLKNRLPDPRRVETMIAASPLFLQTMISAAKNNQLPLKIGAENCFYKDSGAYTGEVSPKALSRMGISDVIVGHSERRKYFNETDQLINRKVKAVFRNQMTPIICCDETMGRLDSGDHSKWVVNQVIAALHGIESSKAVHVVIAYEPSWAIGTGHSASPAEAQESCYLIRQTLADIYSDSLADQVRILYGGSVTPKNIRPIMKQTDIDGILAGGASLRPSTFLKLVNYQN